MRKVPNHAFVIEVSFLYYGGILRDYKGNKMCLLGTNITKLMGMFPFLIFVLLDSSLF